MTAPYVNMLSLTAKESISYLRLLLGTDNILSDHEANEICDALRKNNAEEQRQEIEDAWYKNLRSGNTDYGIYESNSYIAEGWYCWHTYSRKYLQQIQKPNLCAPIGIVGRTKSSEVVVDLGNGIGFTSVALSQIYPAAQVYGTNVAGSNQYKLGTLLSKTFGFQMCESEKDIGVQADVVFASEYFEHFHNPIEHLDQVVKALNPKNMLFANTFGGDASGHFDSYEISGTTVAGKSVGRLFGKALTSMGYTKVKTKMWNNRPSYYTKEFK